MNIAAPPVTEPFVALAFGAEAERRLRTLGHLPFNLIVTDATRCAEALAEAVALKMSGSFVAGAIVMPEPRSVVARLLASAVVAQAAEDDRRRALFDELAAGTLKDNNGVPFSQMTVYGEPVVHTLVAFARLVDKLVVGSWIEYDETAHLISYRHANPQIVPGHDEEIPAVTRVPRPSVVVWGPHKTANELAMFAYALADLHVPYSVVCRDASDAILPGRYLKPVEAATVLSEATVIVDSDLCSPATAIGLSALGAALAVDSRSGSREHVAAVHEFSSTDRKSVLEATRIALGSPSSSLIETVRQPRLELSPEKPPAEPMVTIVLLTCNRPALFKRALQSLLNQKYRNLEVLVHNRGESVDDIVNNVHVPIRSLRMIHKALFEEGWKAIAEHADGKYFGILYDDDMLFPNHISSLTAALERSGAGAAWADSLVRYLQPINDVQLRVVGYGLWNNFHQPFDRVSLLGQCTLGNMITCLMRRDLFIEVGTFDPTFKLFDDWDLCIRLAKADEFVYVDRVTSQYSRFLDATNRGTQQWSGALDDTRRIFEKHPSDDRFTIAAKRNAVLQAHSTAIRPPNLPPIHFESATIDLDR